MAERSNDLGRETGLEAPCVSATEFCATALSVPRNTTANSFFQDIDHPSLVGALEQNVQVYASSVGVGNSRRGNRSQVTENRKPKPPEPAHRRGAAHRQLAKKNT